MIIGAPLQTGVLSKRNKVRFILNFLDFIGIF